MNNSAIFKAAHALTKATVQAGDSYAATFAAALRIVIAEGKADSLAARHIAAGGKEWIKGDFHRIYMKGGDLVSFARKSQQLAADNAEVYLNVKSGKWVVDVRGYGLGRSATAEVREAILAKLRSI